VISRRIGTRIKEALYVARNGRRRWSSEAKRAIVAAGFAPGAVVRDVARQNDVTVTGIAAAAAALVVKLTS
jgi:transposase-like protein